MIDQATIDRILDAAQIVDVVSEYVTLRKRGVNYVGLCPFHDEKTPSFSVSPSKGICKCFSCGKGGNVVHFIMEHEQMSYYEALKFLAKKYNIEIHERELTSEEKLAQSKRESMFIVNEFANGYFQNILRNHIEGKSVGLAYLRKRGFRDDIIKKFQIGFSTSMKDALANEALNKGYKKEFLSETGLCYETNDHKLRDRFWGRVIFPVHTLSGKVVAFGGRVLSTENKKVAKYVNSPESSIYHKSSELYGIYFAKKEIVKQDKCFLVEGYTDVVSMHQSGIENVVASSGTSLTPGQIKMIHRFTNNITVLYDGDKAGIKASLRGIDMLLEEGMNIKVVLLPEGEDPDSFAKQNDSQSFQQYISASEVDFINFKTSLLIEEAGKDPIKKAELISDIVHSISVIPQPITRSVYLKECSQLLNIDEKILTKESSKLIQQELEKQHKQQTNKIHAASNNNSSASSTEEKEYNSFIPEDLKEGKEFYKNEQLIIQLIIRYGEKYVCNVEIDENTQRPISVIEYVVDSLEADKLQFHNAIHRKILEEARQHINDENFESKRFFMSHPDAEISKAAANLVIERYQLSKYHSKGQKILSDEERLYEIVPLLLDNFKNAIVEEEIKHVLNILKDPSTAQDQEKCEKALVRYKELLELQKIMAKHLGDRVILPY